MKYDFQMTARLAKACPLCGSKNVVTYKRDHQESHQSIHPGSYYAAIECADCGLTYLGDKGTNPSEAYRIALKAWNRRSA